MPFVETYAVDFSNGNLQPHVNPRNWPDMQMSPQSLPLTQAFRSPAGITLIITRPALVAQPASNSVYLLPPPEAIPLNMRLLTRVTFDQPCGDAPSPDPHGPLDGELDPAGGGLHSDHGPFAGQASVDGGLPWAPDPAPCGRAVTEAWAVALNVSPTQSPTGPQVANMTCQFNPERRGVRLNTPRALQQDQAAVLESPLDYGNYHGGYMAFPNGTDGEVDPPLFTMEHSFCGWGAAANGHTIGNGTLRISRTWQPEVQDHRVYSTNALLSGATVPTSIGALGVSVATVEAVGRMKARLRTFSVWLNESSS